MALAELRPSVWDAGREEQREVETRGGIPIFNGDPSHFQEWEFRVRAKIAAQADKDHQKAMTIRLIEGLRGEPFKLAQGIGITELQADGGVDNLINNIK